MLTWLPWILQESQPWGGGGRRGWLLILLVKPPPSLASSLPRPGRVWGGPLIRSLKLERPDFIHAGSHPSGSRLFSVKCPRCCRMASTYSHAMGSP